MKYKRHFVGMTFVALCGLTGVFDATSFPRNVTCKNCRKILKTQLAERKRT